MNVPRLLFVCVENSCRSQMAQGWARHLGGTRVAAYSAGSRPSGVVNPLALSSMAAIGCDLAGQSSRSIEEVVAEAGPAPFDAVVTMGCGDACPWVAAVRHLDWALPDPKHLPPAEFAAIRDEIGARVAALLTELGVATD